MKTILVVDDERHIVDLVRLYLEKEGFAVVDRATTARSARTPRPPRPGSRDPRRHAAEARRVRGLPRDPPTRRHARPDADRAGRRRRRDRRTGARRRRLRHEAVQPASPRRAGQGDPPPDRRDGARRPADRGRRRCGSIRAGARPASPSGSSPCAHASSTCSRPSPAIPASSSPATRCSRTSGAPTSRARRGRSTSTSASCAGSSAPDGPPIETVRGVGYRLVPPPREPVRPAGD